MSEKELRSAITRGLSTEVARILAENPALSQVVHPLFGTMIQQAAMEGRSAIVVHLLDAGCPVDLPDRRGTTALYLAIAGRHDETEQLLLSRGAQQCARTRSLHQAIRFLEATAEGRKDALGSLSNPETAAHLNEAFFTTFHEQKKKWLSEQSGEALGWLYENAISPNHGLRNETHIVQTLGPGDDSYGSPDERCAFVLDYLDTKPRRVRGMSRQ